MLNEARSDSISSSTSTRELIPYNEESYNIWDARMRLLLNMIWICKWAVCFSTCLVVAHDGIGERCFFFSSFSTAIRRIFPTRSSRIHLISTKTIGNNKEAGSQAGRSNRRSLIRTASTDELEVMLCLNQLCLANGHVPGKDFGCSRLLAHSAGFYGLALALVSHLTRTRSLALRVTTPYLN